MNRNIKRASMVGAVCVGAVLALTAESCSTNKNSDANRADQQVTSSIADRLQKNQPVPSADWSQQRQTLIDVLHAQIHGQATTSFGFLEGVPAGPIWQCPSVGYPVASTAQLTNPEAEVGPHESRFGIPQMEPNGVFTGESTATFVVCVAPNGDKYIQYWEGYVANVGGPAKWVPGQGVVLDGKPTVEVHTK